MATQNTPETTLTGTPKEVLASYLKDRVTGDSDAPHRGLPFITEKGILRVKPSDFIDWFAAEKPYTGEEPSKTVILKVLKDAGLVQRVYPLPAHDEHPELKGKSFGLYTAKAPSGTAQLPRLARVEGRVKPAETENPTPEPAPKPAGGEQVPASALKVGDTIATTRKGLETGDVIAKITDGPGGRVQARNAEGKMIRSFAGDTKTWVKRA